jgi:hypothetical protein
MARSLAVTLRMLHASGINASAHITNEGRILVWICDAEKRVADAAFFDLEQLADAAEWLVGAAVAQFPKSDFAKVQELVTRALAH